MKKAFLLIIATSFLSLLHAQTKLEAREDEKYFELPTTVTTDICTEIFTCYNPDTREYDCPSEEEQRKQQLACAESVNKCEGGVECIYKLAPELGELIRKRASKPGRTPISDDIYKIIKELIKDFSIKLKRNGKGILVLSIIDNTNKPVYKRNLKKTGIGLFVSPASDNNLLDTKLIEAYSSKKSFANKVAVCRNLFNGVAFAVRLEIK